MNKCVDWLDFSVGRFSQQLRTRGVDMSFDTYRTHVTTLPNSNSVNLSISQNASSVKGTYHVLRSSAKYQSRLHDSLSEYKSGNLTELQFDMGGKLTPEMPLKLANDGHTQLFSHNLQAWNMFRNLSLDTQITDKNFSTTEPAAAPNGNATASYKALPVRRIYGVWVANGPGVYDKRHINVSAAGAEQEREGEYVKMALADGDVYDGNTLVGAHDLHFTNWVTTLCFVPNDVRDLHLVEEGMRAKIGCATGVFPATEATTDANFDIQSAKATSNQFMNLAFGKINAAHANGHIVANANLRVGGAERTTQLGLGRFHQPAPASAYRVTSTAAGAQAPGVVSAVKNNQHEEDGKNLMYPGKPCMVAWGHGGVAGTYANGAITKTGIKERFISGIGIPFVDGQNRPILSRRVGEAFEGWADLISSDSGFYVSTSMETHQENPGLVSGSDLTNSVPLQLKLTYQGVGGGTGAQTDRFYEDKTTSDPFTSFVHQDAILRVQPDGTVISSV